MAWGVGITTGWGETEVFMEVLSRRLAIVQHRHPPARGLLSLNSLLSAFPLTGINRNQSESPLLWSPLAPPPTWTSTRPMAHSLALLTSIQPRPGTIVMRSWWWHPIVPTLSRPHLIWLRPVEVAPRRRCLSTLAEWLTACPTGDPVLVPLPTRFYLLMWPALIRTRPGAMVIRPQQRH